MRNLLIRLSIKYQGDYNKIAKAIKNKEEVDESIEIQQAVTILDENYPKELMELKKPPFVLFYEGNIDLLKERKIAIVGSRKASKYGVEVTKNVCELLRNEYVIVSGLAKGIDANAHIHAKRTIAVLGNGLDYIYPYENEFLYEELKKNQLVISEYPYHTKPEKYHFPFRNRIIAALVDKVIVTEAAKRSGTMLTVNEALALGKEIYAVPYPFDSENGQGCNMLIESGAYILTSENMKSLFDK